MKTYKVTRTHEVQTRNGETYIYKEGEVFQSEKTIYSPWIEEILNNATKKQCIKKYLFISMWAILVFLNLVFYYLTRYQATLIMAEIEIIIILLIILYYEKNT